MEWYGQLVSCFSKQSFTTPVLKIYLIYLALSNAITYYTQHFGNPSVPAGSAAFRISLNTGEGVFYGQKFKAEKVCLAQVQVRRADQWGCRCLRMQALLPREFQLLCTMGNEDVCSCMVSSHISFGPILCVILPTVFLCL